MLIKLSELQTWKIIRLPVLRPFSKKAEVLADPYSSLDTHINDMKSRMTQVQERLQNVPAIKTAGEDGSKMDLPALFEDITHGVALLEDQLGGDESAEHKMIEELENKLWKLEEECGIIPKLDKHEQAEPEHKEVVEKAVEMEKKAARPDLDDLENPDNPGHVEEHDLMDSFVQLSNGSFALVQSHNEGGMIEVDILGKTENGYKYVTDSPIPVPVSAVKRELDWDEIQALKIEHEPWPTKTSEIKQADQVTDETETLVSNDPAVVNSFTPDTTTAPTFQNIQPTDNDNLEIPVAKPTSPPAPGQVWVFNPDDGVYVSMPDPANPGKTI
jgi:hypothetical protein